MKNIKALLFIIIFSKNVDPIFFGSIIGALKSLYQRDIIKMNSEFYNVSKLEFNPSAILILFIYLNILSTYLLNKGYDNNLSRLNEEISIYEINERNFSPTNPEYLKKELEFQLNKELYYTQQQKQRILNLETIDCLQQLNNIKYL